MKKIQEAKLVQYALYADLTKQRMDKVYETLYRHSYGFGWNSAIRVPTGFCIPHFQITAKGFMMSDVLKNLTEDKVVYGDPGDDDLGLRDCDLEVKEMEEEGVLEYYESINNLF